MEAKALFGGAISCCLPKNSVDLSDLRDVPSHQECWFIETDQLCSILFTLEILERQENIPDDRIAEYLFRDLAEANNDSSTSSFQAQQASGNTLTTPKGESVVIRRGTGLLRAAMASSTTTTTSPSNPQHHQTSEEVQVQVCVIRLPEQSTEILLTITVPTKLLSSSSTDYPAAATIWMDEMMESFRVQDWGLFG